MAAVSGWNHKVHRGTSEAAPDLASFDKLITGLEESGTGHR